MFKASNSFKSGSIYERPEIIRAEVFDVNGGKVVFKLEFFAKFIPVQEGERGLYFG
jgi:hypothetical protein